MPTYGGTPVLTPDQAEQAQRAVNNWLANQGYDEHEMPVLYKPGHEGPKWVLSLEGADDWAIRISQDEAVTWPAGVFVEPVAGWCLGLYPA